MANEDVLGPRKTMFVLVIVVGCFAILWPRILSPLMMGPSRDQLKPNKFDREAGCCEVMYETEVAVLEILNEVCNSVVHVSGKLSPFAAAECRKTVNETCGVDIAAFLKRDENVGKTSRKLIETMKSSNSSCLKEHFGVPVLSLSSHPAINSWTLHDSVKQERPPIRGGPHPALRERGRAIPPGAPAKPTRAPVVMPPHVRVRSPLAGYFELEIQSALDTAEYEYDHQKKYKQPPPIPGMRPPLGSPGGPVTAPKSSMGFVMPIYTICIIVFFVYTLSKILFKRSAGPYESISPDPQFNRRVFRDESRSSPDKLGPKERDTIVTAISGLVAEVRQQMETSYAQCQQNQEAQDSQTRSYTNGTILHNSGPVHIVASQYQESTKEKSPEPKETIPEPTQTIRNNVTATIKESAPESKEPTPESKEPTPELEEPAPQSKEPTPESKESTPESREPTPESKEPTPESREATPESKEPTPESKQPTPESKEPSPVLSELTPEEKESTPEKKLEELQPNQVENEIITLTENLDTKNNHVKRSSEEFLEQTRLEEAEDRGEVRKSTSQLLAEALKEESPEKEELEDHENASVKHEAEDVQEIFLQTEIPQQSRVIVTDFGEDTAAPIKKQPLVVSGKMTLSLIQDEPRDTPEKELESTVDDYTTASGITQPAEEQENPSDEEEEEEEMEEEIEIEEIEEEVTDEEEADIQGNKPKKN